MIPEFAAWIWAGTATVAAAAAALVRVRSGVDETTAQLWREEAEAWKAKAERLEEALNDLTRRVANLESENQTLRALHDSRAEVLSLRDAVLPVLAEIRMRLDLLMEKERKSVV